MAEWVYGGDVLCVVFSDNERAVLSLPPEPAKLYLFRARSHRSLAPVSGSHVAPGFFLDHWEVAPYIPKRDMRERTVHVGAADESFSSACAQIGKAGTLRIYLAEFETPPVFDSQWIPGGDPEGVAGWYALGLQNVEALGQQAIAHLTAAAAANADVVVFPELTITDAIRSEISDWLSENSRVDEGGHGLKLVVCGSFHVGGSAQPDGRPWMLLDSIAPGAARQGVPSAAGHLRPCAGSTGSFVAARSGRQMSLPGRYAELCIATLNGSPNAEIDSREAVIGWCSRGRSTMAASHCMNSSGDFTRCVVPSRHAGLSLSSTCRRR